jgi:plastocyanin
VRAMSTDSASRTVSLLLALVTVLVATSAPPALAASAHSAILQDADLPPVELDALDEYRWSLTDLQVAPGQVIRITNRGAMEHTFAVAEWGIDVPLPTLQTVEVVVPENLTPGEQFTFFCSEPGHRALGQEGTITIVTPEAAREAATSSQSASSERILLETSDDFAWSLASIEAEPGQFIEVRNGGVLEHHFVVDEWGVNETISAGELKLIQVPPDVRPGDSFVFYCSVPGHREGGMEGTITIIEPRGDERGDESVRRSEADLGRFLPPADALGDGWSLVRTGNARSVLPDYEQASSRVFPGEGRGATYVGPHGSRATVIVLPFSATDAPTNQIEDAVLAVQLMMMAEWDADLRLGAALNEIAPPAGCDTVNRASGVTRIYTLPAGSTVCQLRSAGIAIFVAVEGQYGDWSGVEAADQVVSRVLLRATGQPDLERRPPHDA